MARRFGLLHGTKLFFLSLCFVFSLFLGTRPNVVNAVTSLLSDHCVLKLGCLTVLTELGTILNCSEASSF